MCNQLTVCQHLEYPSNGKLDLTSVYFQPLCFGKCRTYEEVWCSRLAHIGQLLDITPGRFGIEEECSRSTCNQNFIENTIIS